MIQLLLILLIILLFVVAYFSRFDLMSPVVWAVAGFAIGAAGGVLNYSTWGDISETTIFAIIISLIPFLIGSIIGRNITVTFRKNTYIAPNYNRNIHFHFWFVTIMNVFMIVVGLFYLRFMFQNSIIGGNVGGWQHMFSYARLGIASEDALPMGFGLSSTIKISFGFAHVQTYILIQDIIYRGRKSIRTCDAISAIIYLIHTILSGGRTKMLYFVVYVTVIAILMNRNKRDWDRASRRAGLKYIVLGVITGLTFFWGIDQTVRGSVYGSTFTMWDQFSKYISSPIYTLDVYLQNPTKIAELADTETLNPLISILNKLGANIPFSNNALEFVTFGKNVNVMSNIYTAIRRYIHDYGYVGLTFFMFIEGWIYSNCYTRIRKHKTDGIWLILYGILVYPAAFYFIEERFLNDLFTLTMFFQIICVIVFWKLANNVSKNSNQETR